MKPLETRSNEGSEAYDTQSHEEASDVGEITHGERFERFERDDVGMGDTAYRHRPLREFRERYPDEYIEPWETSVRAEEFPSPEKFAHDINPEYSVSPPHQVNCCDCGRAVERTWRGDRETAAGRFIIKGETPDQMESWAGERFKSVDVRDIRERVNEAGHGASAIVGACHESSDGVTRHHVYNVVNHGDEIRVVDGQTGLVSPWSDETGHPELSNVSDWSDSQPGVRGRSMVMGWDARGNSLW